MSIAAEIRQIREELPPNVRLVAVSKYHPATAVQEAYDAGQRLFGESIVQEITEKYPHLPADIEWHFIGHLQANKVKYLAPFIHTVQSVDSVKILDELDKFAAKNKRKIRVLLQVHIAQEEHKFGFSYTEIEELLQNNSTDKWQNLIFAGLMGLATFTDDENQVHREFADLHAFFVKIKQQYFAENPQFIEVSMGMSDDYLLAIEEGSTMVRIGSKIFGTRNYEGKI
jgi:pyridoxal phosphate enzyme (YggS family)